MNSVEVLKGFPDNPVIANALWVDECDSTMVIALAHAVMAGPASGGFVVGAGHQRAGRGRLDRRWESRPGASMLATYAIWPEPGADCGLALSALGLSVRAAVVSLGGPQLGLKWPNDLVVAGDGWADDVAALGRARPVVGDSGAADNAGLVGKAGLVDKKVGGLLGETHRVGDRSLILLGVGVNLASDAVPPELCDRATALDALGFSVDAADLMCAGAGQLASRVGDCVATAAHPAVSNREGRRLIDEYRAACVTIGRTVRVEMPSGELIGVAVDVEDDGALVIEPSGQGLGQADRVTVRTGDVTHLRDHRPA